MEKTKQSDGSPVLVTTKDKGVFFGYLDDETLGRLTVNDDEIIEKLTIKRARNCVYWSSDVRGFLGLASIGPSKSCRIGPPAPSLTLFSITSVAECSPEAVEKMEAAPWQG